MASAVADAEPSSGDFMVLDSTSRPPNLSSVLQGDACEQALISQREEAILKLCGICGYEDDGKNQRPFRIVVVGKHGAGKSSFINGVAAALSEDRWHEYAYTGNMGSGVPITIGNQRLAKCSNGDRERYQNVLLPTIIDVAGLSDEGDDKLEELFRLLFYGHIEEDQPLWRVYEDCKDHTKEEVRDMYSETYPEMRVDRVIFVASTEDALPERLMACVQRAARPSHHRTERRAVPIYGILTKMDKVDMESTTYLDKKKTFMQILGLNHSRFLVCSNYCDDLDPQGQRVNRLQPELDLPLLRFMQLVCDRALKVVKEDEVLRGTGTRTNEARQNAANAERQAAQRQGEGGEAAGAGAGRGEGRGGGLAAMWRTLEPMFRDAITAAVAGLLVLVVLVLVLPPAGQENAALTEACSNGTIITDPKFKKLLCGKAAGGGAAALAWAQFQQRAGMILAITLVTIIVFLYQHVNRRL